MKTIIAILIWVPGLILAQDTLAPRITCQKIEIQNMGPYFNTQNEKGEPMIMISALEVKIDSRRCYDKGFNINLPSGCKNEYTKPVFCRWDPVNRYWKKMDETQKESKGEKKISYNNKIKCPGLYAFFEKPEGNEKGIKIRASGKYRIKKVSITQTNPDFRIIKEFENTNREIIIPTVDLQFHARIQITYLSSDREIESEYLIGALTNLEENPEGEGYRIIKFNPSELQSLTIKK